MSGTDRQSSYELTILTPKGEVFSGQVSSALLSTAAGMIEVLPGHEPLLSLLKEGVVAVQEHGASSETRFSLDGGFLQVGLERTLILADAAGRAES